MVPLVLLRSLMVQELEAVPQNLVERDVVVLHIPQELVELALDHRILVEERLGVLVFVVVGVAPEVEAWEVLV